MPAQSPGPPAPPAVPYETEAELIRTHLRMWRFAARNRHVTIPLIVPVGMLAAGAVLAGEHATFEAGVIGAAASVTTWFTAPSKWSPEPRIKDWRWTSEVAYARSTVGGGTLWLFLAAMFGPGQTWLEVMLAALCAAWGGLFWWHKRPRDRRARRHHERRVRDLNMWWQLHAPGWSAGGSGITDVRDHDGMESWLVQLWGGKQTIATIKSPDPAAGIRARRLRPPRHDPPRDQQGQPVAGVDPPQARGPPPRGHRMGRLDGLRTTSPTPRRLGVPRDRRVEARQPAVRVVRASAAPGPGKSNEESVMLAKATRCRNARVLLIDMKGGRAARPWLPAIDWVATTIEEARLALRLHDRPRPTPAARTPTTARSSSSPPMTCPPCIVVIDETYGSPPRRRGRPRRGDARHARRRRVRA